MIIIIINKIVFQLTTRYIQTNFLRRSIGRSEDLKLYLCTFFFSFFCQSIALSSHVADSHQMYSGGSVIGKASTIGIEISSTPPLIFTWVKKYEILRRFQRHSTLNHPRLKMQQDIRTLKQISCEGMIVLCPRQV